MAKPRTSKPKPRASRRVAAPAPKARFCCFCGFKLKSNGTCPNSNPPCDWGGQVPSCR
jgi:hypothetical protein